MNECLAQQRFLQLNQVPPNRLRVSLSDVLWLGENSNRDRRRRRGWCSCCCCCWLATECHKGVRPSVRPSHVLGSAFSFHFPTFPFVLFELCVHTSLLVGIVIVSGPSRREVHRPTKKAKRKTAACRNSDHVDEIPLLQGPPSSLEVVVSVGQHQLSQTANCSRPAKPSKRWLLSRLTRSAFA